MNPRIPQIIADLVQFESNLRQLKSTQEIANQLASIKAYAAELYLETDMEIIAQNANSISKTPEPIEEVVESQPLFKPTYEDDVDVSEGQEVDNAEFLTIPFEENMDSPKADISEELQNVNDATEIQSKQEFEIELGDNSTSESHGYLDDESVSNDLGISPQDEKYDQEFDEDLQKLQHLDELTEEEESLKSTRNNDPDLFSTVDESIDIEVDETPNEAGKPQLEQRAQEILSMFSFSRRFEFCNFLFGGDMKLFAVFITEMLAAGNSEEREDVFDNWYNQSQWSRRDESANDLKRNLRKMI